MANDTMIWLQDWYQSQCDGDWEHQQGVQIGTLDNPGWGLDIDLVGTPLEGLKFESLRIERSERDWLFCEVKEGKFKAACGPGNLMEAIEAFRGWVSGRSRVSS